MSPTLRVAARAVLDCGVGNLSGSKYRARVEAFDALDDALEAATPTLDDAWREAEGALPPESWSLTLFRTMSGDVLGYGIESRTPPPDGWNGQTTNFVHGATLPAALLALASALRDHS